MDPLITIVIVNFNSGDYLYACLESIQKQTYWNWELIIVDNASTDNSLSLVNPSEKVQVICNAENKGFAAGQNQGISRAGGEFILTLNYDLRLEPDFLHHISTALSGDKEAGWACGKLLAMTSKGEIPGVIYSTGHLLPFNRFPLLRGNGEVDNRQYEQTEYVPGAPGAAALYKRSMIEDICFNGQFFDETFFTWCEDVDVDWRARNRNWKCLYVPQAVAYHVGHVGENFSEPFLSFRTRLTIRNRWLMILANETDHRKVIWPIIRYEISLIIFVIRDCLFKAYLGALLDTVKLAPIAFAKRKVTLGR